MALGGARRGRPRVHQANGVKIGEVTHDSAVIWTRLTRAGERNVQGVPFKRARSKRKGSGPEPQIPEGRTLDDREGSVPGARGEVRVVYWPEGREQEQAATPWKAAEPGRDFTRQFALSGLRPGTAYRLRAESRAPASGPAGQPPSLKLRSLALRSLGEGGQPVEGRFRTAPDPASPARVVFTVVTGQEYSRRDDEGNGHRIYPAMARLDPSFFVHTGDIVYYDKPGPHVTSLALARFKWNRIYGMPFQREFHNSVASYFIKDDHDTWQDDCWPSMKNSKMGRFTFEEGLGVFLEQVPMGRRTYRTVRWGADLQIWLVEGRDFRSPNPMRDGPRKTIWGAEQKAWFFRTVRGSVATFRVLVSPTPLVGPDRTSKNDNHANRGFACEGNELRRFIATQKNMVVVCGDRHWQYVSVDPKTGLREYSCGPTSDRHAGGWRMSQRKPMHRYLKVCGGFLSGTVERIDGKPALTFRHHGVDGKVLNEDRLVAE